MQNRAFRPLHAAFTLTAAAILFLVSGTIGFSIWRKGLEGLPKTRRSVRYNRLALYPVDC
jgi:hypothetical protein